MHIIDSMHGGGAETSILEIAPALRSRGVQTSIITLLKDDGCLDGRIDDLGITCTRLGHRYSPGTMLELRKMISTEKPDLIHTTLLFANLAGRITAITTRIPVVTTLANTDYGPEHRRNSRYGPWSVRAVQAADMASAPLTTRFHAISANVATVMSHRLKIPMDRIEVIYRGRDPARLGTLTANRRLHARRALAIETDAPVVLSVARLDWQKGVDTTIDAFRRLVKHYPRAVLLVAGRPGNASAVIRAKAQDCSMIRFLGHRTDIPDLMCAADVLSFPSRWEGLGGTLVEAMALRLAVVASDIAPLAETIGDVGWPLVRPDDGADLAEALASVLARGAVNERRKEAGVERFQQVFTADAAADRMVKFYREALIEARRRR
ncbi:MAG: glycosyltransferase family 4 protein [Streptosporangiaceae bacterium]